MTDTNRKDEILSALTDGITKLTTSERWQEWLDVQSRFHHYSFRNALLIQLQCPRATRVAGFRAWQQLGRQVRKGEKAIWILAPVTRRATNDDRDSADTEGALTLVAFKPACVFDVSQTDGAELPEPCHRLEGDAPTAAYAQLVAVAHRIGFTVEDHEFAGNTNGDCNFATHKIRVRTGSSPLQRVKTLAHELAHALLHEHHQNRALAELEAESVAYVVCANLGINSEEYSLGYVATWAGGGDEAITAIKESAGRIQRTADHILSGTEAASAGSDEAA